MQQKAFSIAKKVSRAAKNESDFNYDNNLAFDKFYRDFKRLKEKSVGSKYNNVTKFLTLLDVFKIHKAITINKSLKTEL